MGTVPEGWSIIPCRAVVEDIAEKNVGAADQNYLSVMANVGVIKYEDKGDIGNKKPDDLSKCKIVKAGNLVINSMNYAIGSYGMSPYNGVCSPVYIVLGVNEEAVESRFALRIFENTPFQKYLATFGNGILEHRAAIDWDDIKRAHIAVPSKYEQRAILNFLDHETAKIDALIEKQQRLIELLKEKRQAVISHAVTKGLNPNAPMKDSGVEWMGKVPQHWKVGALGYNALISSGATPDRNNPAYWNGNIPWIKTGEVKYEEIFEAEEYISEDALHDSSVKLSPPGTLLMAMYGQGVTRGRVALLGVAATYNQACAAITPSPELFNQYLLFFFMAAYHAIRDGGNETSQMNLNAEIVGKFKVAIPSLKEQHQIVTYLKPTLVKFDSMINRAESAILLMQERRTALISAAVTGKIDVRDWQAAA